MSHFRKNRKPWYSAARVERYQEEGKTTHIEVSFPNAFGTQKRVTVESGADNEFMADVILGLLFEINQLQKEREPHHEQTSQTRRSF